MVHDSHFISMYCSVLKNPQMFISLRGKNDPQALGENREMATRNDLGSLEEWTGTKGGLPHIPGHVGVTDQAVAPRLGHSEHSTTEEAAIIYFDFSYTRFFV